MGLGQAEQNCTYYQRFVWLLYTCTVALSLYTCIVEPGASLASPVPSQHFILNVWEWTQPPEGAKKPPHSNYIKGCNYSTKNYQTFLTLSAKQKALPALARQLQEQGMSGKAKPNLDNNKLN